MVAPPSAVTLPFRVAAVLVMAVAAEEVTDLMEEFVSPGAVRAVQDKATEAQLKKADEAVEQFVYGMVKASKRQPDGSDCPRRSLRPALEQRGPHAERVLGSARGQPVDVRAGAR